jgi:hypothetical protein
VHVQVLFCTRAMTYWMPALTLEERWSLTIGLEALVLVVAAYFGFQRFCTARPAQVAK